MFHLYLTGDGVCPIFPVIKSIGIILKTEKMKRAIVVLIVSEITCIFRDVQLD